MGYKARDKVDMGVYIQNTKEQEAWRWCINNNIKIAPSAISTTEWRICITINGKDNLSPEAYKKVEIWKKLYEYCLYYYNKHHNISNSEPMIVKKEAKSKQKQITTDNQLF